MARVFQFFSVLLVTTVCPCMTSAGVILNIYEDSGGIVARATGQLNLAALNNLGSSFSGRSFIPGKAMIGIGGIHQELTHIYGNIQGPTSFGGVLTDRSATTSSGDFFGINGSSSLFSTPVIQVATSYVSGSQIDSYSFFSGINFADLQLSEGSYVYSWGAGDNADFATVNIGAAAVPEPSSLAAFALSFLVGACVRRRQSRNKKTTEEIG